MCAFFLFQIPITKFFKKTAFSGQDFDLKNLLSFYIQNENLLNNFNFAKRNQATEEEIEHLHVMFCFDSSVFQKHQ